MFTTLASIGSEFQREIVDTGRLAAFLFFVGLLGTFGFIRTSTHMIRAQVSWWPGNVNVGGTHVHHLVWGIFAMMIFGYVGVVLQPDSPWREIVTVFFAIGVVFAAVNAAKEKFGMSVVALVFWPAAVPSAVRVAKPHSLWARLFYRGA